MKLAVFDNYRPGLVEGDSIFDLSSIAPSWCAGVPTSINSFLSEAGGSLNELADRVRATVAPTPLDSVTLRAPVPMPPQLLAAPLNYAEHRKEMHGPLTSGPGTANELGFFLKASRSVSDPSAPILLPNLGRRIDFEAEVAIVIGKEARGVSPAEALNHVLGYTMLLDMTVRMTEDKREERVQRKSYSTFTPMGPWITTADEIPDPSAITIKAWLNDELRQDATLTDLIVDVPELISRASHVVSLDAGDVYATGSPAGVGQVQAGDTLRIESPELGSMSLAVAARPW